MHKTQHTMIVACLILATAPCKLAQGAPLDAPSVTPPATGGTSTNGSTANAVTSGEAASAANRTATSKTQTSPVFVNPAESILSEDVPQAAPNSRPPPYTLLRFNEEYQYLADPTKRTDPFDSVKYIPLDRKNPHSYLSIGGEIRERFESFENPYFGTKGVSNTNYLLQRVTLGADLHVDEHLRFFVQGISGYQFGGTGEAPAVDQDAVNLQQAFVDYIIGDPDAHDLRLTLRGGRFEMTFGSGRLIATRAGPNIPQKFDGGEFILAHEKSRLYGFYVRPGVEVRNHFDGEDDSQMFWGIYGTTPLGGPLNTSIDLYYLGLRTEDARFAEGTANEERHTFGTRLFGKVGPWDYDTEAALQAGRFGDENILAWTFASDVGYTFESLPGSPRLGNKVDIASGDTGRRNGTLGTFNPLFFKAGYFSDASLIRPSNIIDVHPSIQFRPMPPVLITLASDLLWRYSTRDAIYAPPGFIELAPNSSSAYVGTTAEAAVQWSLDRHWSLTASYMHLFSSDAVQNAGGHDVDFLGTWLTFTW